MEWSKITGGLGGGLEGASAGSAFGPWGSVVGGTLGAVTGFLGGGGEDEAQKLAEQQAKFIRMTEDENQRRLSLQLDTLLGTNKAKQYASNILASGSSKRYQEVFESTFRQDMAWQRFAARQREELVKAGGQDVGNQIQSQGITNLFRGLTTAATTFGPMLMNPLEKKAV